VNLSAGGVNVSVPPGWDVRIGRTAQDVAGSRSNTLMHAANFILPDGRGDFGSGAVGLMGSGHVFVVLFEYGADSARTSLFQTKGLPRVLRAEWFAPNQLQRTLPGQAGLQRFFVERGRPFSLYAVLGSYSNRSVLVPMVNDLLNRITISSP
jgi:hypothetical protein